jgi:hypothetical protein
MLEVLGLLVDDRYFHFQGACHQELVRHIKCRVRDGDTQVGLQQMT